MRDGFSLLFLLLFVPLLLLIGLIFANLQVSQENVQKVSTNENTPSVSGGPVPALRPEKSWANSDGSMKAVLIDGDLVMIYGTDDQIINTFSRQNIIEKSSEFEEEELVNVGLDVFGWNSDGSNLWGNMWIGASSIMFWEYQAESDNLIVYDKFHEKNENNFGPIPGTLNMERKLYVYKDKPIGFGVGDLDYWHETHDEYSLFLYDLVNYTSTKFATLPGKFPSEGGMLRLDIEWVTSNEIKYETPDGYKTFILN